MNYTPTYRSMYRGMYRATYKFIRDEAVPGFFKVLDSLGALFTTTNDVLDSADVSHPVSATVEDSNSTGYVVI